MTETSSQTDRRPASGSSSLVEMISDPASPRSAEGATATTARWTKLGILAALFLAFNYWQFRPLVLSWVNDANWSHGFLIPLFSLYLLYCRYDEIRAATWKPSLVGLVLMIGGILWTIVSVFPIQVLWFQQLGMIAILFGLVLYQGGWGVIKRVWLPIVYLVLAIPIPDRLYTLLSVPLQNLAASLSAGMLQALGANVKVVASQLTVTSQSGQIYPLTVAEACSGVRSLMAFVALGVALTYLTHRPVWQRLTLLALIVPVTVAANVIRVAITTYMYIIDKPTWGQDFMHTFLGMALLIPAAAMLWFFAWLMDNFFVVEPDLHEVESDEASAGGGMEGASE